MENIFSFRDYIEGVGIQVRPLSGDGALGDIPPGESNADNPWKFKIRSKYTTGEEKGREVSWRRDNKKSPEQRYGFMKKCREIYVY